MPYFTEKEIDMYQGAVSVDKMSVWNLSTCAWNIYDDDYKLTDIQIQASLRFSQEELGT